MELFVTRSCIASETSDFNTFISSRSKPRVGLCTGSCWSLSVQKCLLGSSDEATRKLPVGGNRSSRLLTVRNKFCRTAGPRGTRESTSLSLSLVQSHLDRHASRQGLLVNGFIVDNSLKHSGTTHLKLTPFCSQSVFMFCIILIINQIFNRSSRHILGSCCTVNRGHCWATMLAKCLYGIAAIMWSEVYVSLMLSRHCCQKCVPTITSVPFVLHVFKQWDHGSQCCAILAMRDAYFRKKPRSYTQKPDLFTPQSEDTAY